MNCKCCNNKKLSCTCDRFIKSLDFELLDHKINIPINKNLKQLGCYEYFYLGDATGYYTYDEENNPIRQPYQNVKFKIEFSIDEEFSIDQFTLTDDNSSAVLKYAEITKIGNILYIESPDERLFRDLSLQYKDKVIFCPFSEIGLFANFSNSGFPELANPVVTNLSRDLAARDGLQISQSVSLQSTLKFAGGTIGSEREIFRYPNPCNSSDRRRHGYAYTCLTANPVNVTGNFIFSTFYTGFLIIFDFKSQQQINLYPTYYTEFSDNFPKEYEIKILSRGYTSYCGEPQNDEHVHTPNKVGCPVIL